MRASGSSFVLHDPSRKPGRAAKTSWSSNCRPSDQRRTRWRKTLILWASFTQRFTCKTGLELGSRN
eukprot:10408871-Heterocapsa_arctica.AAC.1